MFLICLFAPPAVAQRTTNFTGTFRIDDTEVNTFNTTLVGSGAVGTLGTALLQINTFQPLADDGKSGVGQMGSNLTISFNRQDSITIANFDDAASLHVEPHGDSHRGRAEHQFGHIERDGVAGSHVRQHG